jgi:hypothetical protein
MTMSAVRRAQEGRRKEASSQPAANKPAEADIRTARGNSTKQEK